jgi:predicted  nucleic acid-binding Zn-ribbon protein
MKVPYGISLTAVILFVALGIASLLLDMALRDLRIQVDAQEGQVRNGEAHIAEQMRALQDLEKEREALEQENENWRRKVAQQQSALETQQEQINQAMQITQQVAPNLLRDLAAASAKNEKIRSLLANHGYNIQTK